MRVFIGYDPAEAKAYEVAAATLLETSALLAEPLMTDKLNSQGLLSRPVDERGHRYDLMSNAPCSTTFSVSRFLVPLLCNDQWALFTDCDVVFLADVHELLLSVADDSKAVQVVKHQHIPEPNTQKMGGMPQTIYPRKNWSSVMLFNCHHPANRRLTIEDINRRPGRDLHAFYWLHNNEIGELPVAWNWLVDCQPRPNPVKIAHMTLGGPWIEGWEGGSFDKEWHTLRQQLTCPAS